ncbi:MAG: DNA-binding domain-containing protein [Actinomycetota bacterium]|nr:DNA-binding domain-containing protein [Actinomycetota bacterium]
MQAEANLLRLQRRFLAAVREPIFGDSRGRSELPPREGDVSGDFVRIADELITPSATLAPTERLELYHRQYWYRLLDSIAEDFPGLRRLLGDEDFWRLMEAYLEAVPPRSFTLRHLGAGLADFIARGPDLVPNPIHAEDLARVEYALCLAFEAGEEAPLLPGELGEAELDLQPHLTVLALRTPGDTLWRAAKRDGRRALIRGPSPRPNRFVAIYRQDLRPHVERLPRAAFSVLAAICDQGSLEAAMECVTAERGLLRASDAKRVGEWFGRWTARGWFIRRSLRRLSSYT